MATIGIIMREARSEKVFIMFYFLPSNGYSEITIGIPKAATLKC